METVQSVYFCFGAKPANSTFATTTAKKKCENCHSSHWNYQQKLKRLKIFRNFRDGWRRRSFFKCKPPEVHFTIRNRVPYNKIITNRACLGRTGEYWPSVVFVWTSLHSEGSVLSRSRANIPQYGPRARLVRGYYWARLSKISWFVSGEQINYLPKPKACFIIRSPFFWSTKYVKSLSACSGNRSAIFTQDVDSITHEWAEYYLQQNGYLQVTWWALCQWKEGKTTSNDNLNWWCYPVDK